MTCNRSLCVKFNTTYQKVDVIIAQPKRIMIYQQWLEAQILTHVRTFKGAQYGLAGDQEIVAHAIAKLRTRNS